MLIKIAIVDDNKLHIDDIKRRLSECPHTGEYEVYEFLAAEKFVEILEYVKFDVVFLDIVLGEENGIETGKIINEKQPKTRIVFISANPEYFQDVYMVEHSYFLIKDFDSERFNDAVYKAFKNIENESIAIGTKSGKTVINLNDVLYFESVLKHTRVHKIDDEMEEYNVNIKIIEAALPDRGFVRTHQSFIVNMRHIQRYDRQNIYLINGKRIPVSRTYINSVRTEITRFLGGLI